MSLDVFATCLEVCEATGAPYFVENPKSVASTHLRPPDHEFHPWQYAGYLDDIETDNEWKQTFLWTGNGFNMPRIKPHPGPLHRESCWHMGPSKDRGDKRAVTPMGFARAVYEANK